MTKFEWTPKREKAAVALAAGYTQREAAEQAGVARATVQRWLLEMEFSAEVDRLSIMTDIAARAERLRIAKRMIRQLQERPIPTEKDLLDWLKYVQSETDGVTLGLTDLLVEFQGQDEAFIGVSPEA